MECKKKRIFQDTHIAVDDIKKKKIVSLDDVTSEEVYDGGSSSHTHYDLVMQQCRIFLYLFCSYRIGLDVSE